MKYLKLFEDISGWKPYQEITEQDWFGDLAKKRTSLNEKEFLKIKEYANALINPPDGKIFYHGKKIEITGEFPSPYVSLNDTRSTFDKNRGEVYIFTIFQNTMSIYKIEDDWWVIYIPYIAIWDNVKKCRNEYGQDHPWVYYKCDQLEGVKEFFNSKVLEILETKENKKNYPYLKWK